MSKCALLIGINYVGTPNELRGCINDILQTKTMLQTYYGYTQFKLLTDNETIKPTKQNIINELKNIVTASSNYKEIWIHYSGHGAYIVDKNKDERDSRDEVLVPLDYTTSGFIVDDDISTILKGCKCDTKIIMDCCYSGSNTDLYYNAKVSGGAIVLATEKINANAIASQILSISGCTDTQTSSDSYNTILKQSMGALTMNILKVLEESQYKISVYNLLKNVTNKLKLSGETQIPICSSNKILSSSTQFITNEPTKIAPKKGIINRYIQPIKKITHRSRILYPHDKKIH